MEKNIWCWRSARIMPFENPCTVYAMLTRRPEKPGERGGGCERRGRQKPPREDVARASSVPASAPCLVAVCPVVLFSPALDRETGLLRGGRVRSVLSSRGPAPDGDQISAPQAPGRRPQPHKDPDKNRPAFGPETLAEPVWKYLVQAPFSTGYPCTSKTTSEPRADSQLGSR